MVQRGASTPASATVLCLVLLIWPGHSAAHQGVREINQQCATTTGCLPGDTPGLPVTIQASGSYRLTSDLVLPDELTDGIRVQAHFVQVDLGGHAIRGPVTCTGTPVSACTPQFGSGTGISAANFRGVVVRNGAVIGAGSRGVHLGDGGTALDLEIRDIEYIGLYANGYALIKRCRVHRNGGDGLTLRRGAVVSATVAAENGDSGIDGEQIVVDDVQTRANALYGIDASAGSVVVGSTARNNGAGIQVNRGVIDRSTASANGSGGLVVTDGVIHRSESSDVASWWGVSATYGLVYGSTVQGGQGDGGVAASRSGVFRNTIRGNFGVGLKEGFNGVLHYGHNVITDNSLDAVDGGVNAGANFCAGYGTTSSSCP